jgi:hypothetical protein
VYCNVSRCKPYVPLNRDRVLAWDVNPVSVGTILVVADPVPLNGPSIQLGPRVSVYPDALPPFGYTC